MSKRENFRASLENEGVMEALTRALVSLYEEPEQPADPVAYIRQIIGANDGVDVDALVRENQELKSRIAALKQEIDTLESQAAPAPA